jgi:hypothetical protein
MFAYSQKGFNNLQNSDELIHQVGFNFWTKMVVVVVTVVSVCVCVYVCVYVCLYKGVGSIK